MNARLKISMLEVTRLTRDGRIDEAMAILRGATPSAPSSNSRGNTQPGFKGPTIEMAAPSSLTGESWTFPKWGNADLLENPGRPNTLGDLRKSWPQIGLGRGLEGLARPSVNRAPIAVPDGAQFKEHVLANQAGSRAYKLYVPSGYSQHVARFERQHAALEPAAFDFGGAARNTHHFMDLRMVVDEVATRYRAMTWPIHVSRIAYR